MVASRVELEKTISDRIYFVPPRIRAEQEKWETLNL